MLIFAVCAAGFHMGVLNPILPALAADLSLSTSAQSLIFSLLIFAAAFGALGAGKVCQHKCLCVLCSGRQTRANVVSQGNIRAIMRVDSRQRWTSEGSGCHGSTFHGRRAHVHSRIRTGDHGRAVHWANAGRPRCAHPALACAEQLALCTECQLDLHRVVASTEFARGSLRV